MRIITEKAFADLDYPEEISRKDIGNFYCKRMIQNSSCPYNPTNHCSICLPILQEIKNNLQGARSTKAVMLWRLREFAKGNLSIWSHAPKSSPIKRDIFGLPTSESKNPFSQLSERMISK